MSKKKEQPISKKFIFFLIFMFCFGLYYVLRDDKIENIKNNQTYNEQLEYHDEIYDVRKQRLEREQEEALSKKKAPEEGEMKIRQSRHLVAQKTTTPQTDIQVLPSTSNKYERLLDSLKSSPYQSTYYINIIVDELLTFKGYPQGSIKVKKAGINQSRAKVQGSYLVANFDIPTGTLNIEESILSQLPATTIIAVLAHELDHFDKLASTCRYMGVEQFEALLNRNNIRNVDTTFWRIASTFGKTKGFNGEHYKQALERFISQNKLSPIGAYSDFYKLAENLRNPLEISAYEQSDFVYKYYGITVQEGPTQKLVKEFNDIDWLIHNKIGTNKLLQGERIAIFDYLYANALMEQLPELRTTYKSCIDTKDGDLTAFWNAYKLRLKNFYENNGQLNANEFTTLMSIMNSTKTKAKVNLSVEDYAKALENKINTIKNLVLSEEEVKNLKQTSENYIKLLGNNNIENPKQYLNCMLILICIENNLNKHNMNETFSLYYLNFPKIQNDRPSIDKEKSKKQQIIELYNNPSFKAEKPAYMSEQEYLVELINKNRLNVN